MESRSFADVMFEKSYVKERGVMNQEKKAVAVQPDYQSEIIKLVRSRLSPGVMRDRLSDFHPKDIAETLEELDARERKTLYTILPSETVASVLEYADDASVFLGEVLPQKRVQILSCMESALVAEYLKTLEQSERFFLLKWLPDEVKEEVSLLSSFEKDEIGSRMSTNFIAVQRGMSIREAMHSLIDQAAENDNVSKIYVVDSSDTFYGMIDLKDLVVAREGDSLDSLAVTSYPYFYATELIDDCIERIRDYSEDSIPILDSENRLQGVLAAYDMAELIGDELGEDYAKLAGLTAQEDLKEPLGKSIGKRLPWLAILLGLGMIVSVVVGLFENVVANLTIIISFQSLILGMAGNAGTQSLAITIRVLTDEALTGRERLSLFFKEARVGACNGFIMGLLSFVFVGAYLHFLRGESATLAFSVSACTGIALFVAMMLSGMAGTAIPMLFKKLKVDPAVASGPLITTVNDLVAVVAYYGLAWVLLIQGLGL